MLRIVSAAALALALSFASAQAEVAREITWDNLVPEAPPLEDPFSHLTLDQRYDLNRLVDLRDLRTRVLGPDGPAFGEVDELSRKLESDGLDVGELLARYDTLFAEVMRRNESVVDELDGQMVRMPGDALPLEFVESGVTEFLLVPYVGACIHVPPPPPNQMVLVHLDEAFEPKNRFTPVWITGRMSVQKTSSSLSLVDGQADIATGYALEGIEVEPYEE